MIRPHRRGFATLVAVATLPLVALAALALTTLSSNDARRTTHARQDAQLRQFLLAGGSALLDRAGTWERPPGPFEFDVSIPKAMEGSTVHVTVKPDGEAVVARVDARFEDRSAAQQVRLVQNGKIWSIDRATLNPNRESTP